MLQLLIDCCFVSFITFLPRKHSLESFVLQTKTSASSRLMWIPFPLLGSRAGWCMLIQNNCPKICQLYCNERQIDTLLNPPSYHLGLSSSDMPRDIAFLWHLVLCLYPSLKDHLSSPTTFVSQLLPSKSLVPSLLIGWIFLWKFSWTCLIFQLIFTVHHFCSWTLARSVHLHQIWLSNHFTIQTCLIVLIYWLINW